MKPRIIVLALLAEFLGVVAPNASAAEQLETYRVGYNNWIGFVALFYAEKKGYFKAEGLDVKLKSCSFAVKSATA